MAKDKQPLPNLDTTPTDQSDINQLQQFIDSVKDYQFADKLTTEDQRTLQQLAVRLTDISLALETNDQTPIATDRHTRKNLRLIAEPTFEHIEQEVGDDKDLEAQLKASVVSSLARAGIVPASVRVFEALTPDITKPDKKAAPADDYTLTVKPADKAFLESLVGEVESSGKWSQSTTKKAALGFLDIYYPADMQAANNRGSRQEILNAIATCGSYSHAVATALSKLPEIQQTSSIEDVRSEIFKQLKLRATPKKLQQLNTYDDYTIGSVPEIKQFNSYLKGTQYEILAHQALSTLDLDNYRYSSLEEDISKGYDLVLEHNGKHYYLDVKAAFSFANAAEKYRPSSIIGNTKDRGFLVRQTRNLDQNGQTIRVIVVDVETTGAIKYQRNRLQLTNPDNYQATILEAMALVDNTYN